jgi:hypothetical protein
MPFGYGAWRTEAGHPERPDPATLVTVRSDSAIAIDIVRWRGPALRSRRKRRRRADFRRPAAAVTLCGSPASVQGVRSASVPILRGHVRSITLIAVGLLLSACGGGTAPSGGPAPAGMAAATQPAAAVEQFIGLAKQQRYTEMGYIFGTSRGPLAERQAPVRVTRRMQALANVLRHDSYAMTGVVPVSGRPEARMVMVQLRQGRRTVDVPFTVVQGPGGGWLVELVDLQAALESRRGR